MIDDLEVKLNFEKMLAGVFYKDELLRQFTLNKQDPGLCVDWFRLDHEVIDDDYNEKTVTVKHEIIIEIGVTVKGKPLKPMFQVYPIAGDFVIHKEPKNCDVRKGTIEDYFNNHKNYEDDDE